MLGPGEQRTADTTMNHHERNHHEFRGASSAQEALDRDYYGGWLMAPERIPGRLLDPRGDQVTRGRLTPSPPPPTSRHNQDPNDMLVRLLEQGLHQYSPSQNGGPGVLDGYVAPGLPALDASTTRARHDVRHSTRPTRSGRRDRARDMPQPRSTRPGDTNQQQGAEEYQRAIRPPLHQSNATRRRQNDGGNRVSVPVLQAQGPGSTTPMPRTIQQQMDFAAQNLLHYTRRNDRDDDQDGDDDIQQAIRLSMSNATTPHTPTQVASRPAGNDDATEVFWPNIARWLRHRAGPRPRVNCCCCTNELVVEGLQPDDGEREPSRVLACGHIVGSVCIQAWIDEKRDTAVGARCPVCNGPIHW